MKLLIILFSTASRTLHFKPK